MDSMLVVAAISCASLGTAFALLFKKLVTQHSASPLADNWDNLFNPMRYRPLERLLDGRDFDYLASQPGCGAKLVKRLRVERTSIFRCYTRCMRKDFGRILDAIKVIMVHSNVDRPDLARLMMKQRFLFAFAMMQVECRLVMFRIGAGSVSLEAVLAPLDAIRSELRSLALVAQPVGVAAGT